MMDEKELDQIVQDHSALISAGTLAERVASIPDALHGTLQYRFLEAAVYYNAQHKATPPDWQGSYERFLALNNSPETTPFLAFYIPNYLLL